MLVLGTQSSKKAFILLMTTNTAVRAKKLGLKPGVKILEYTPKLPVTGWHRLKTQAELVILLRHSQLVADSLYTVIVPALELSKRILHQVGRRRTKRRRRTVHRGELGCELVHLVTVHLLQRVVQKNSTILGGSHSSDIPKLSCQHVKEHITQL
jgi:hypothetical protein